MKLKQWKKVVVTIGKASYQEGWMGLCYHEMRVNKLVEEKTCINQLIVHVQAGLVKYGCSMLFDGWSERKKRGFINILISSPLGTYFVCAVGSAKGDKKTMTEFIYRHIHNLLLR